MDKYTATEMAYKHGYEKGYEDGKKAATDNNVGSKWIPVSERLPEEDEGVVLVYSGDVEPAIMSGNIFLEYDKYEGWEINNVTHWMPLPEPPKEGE